MITEKINTFKDLPLEDRDRMRTDIFCSIIGALYGLTLFIMAIVMLSTDNYKKSNFPTDSDHIPCSYGVNKNYPFVYFPNINDINIRVCLSRCPNVGDPELSCRVNTKVPTCALHSIYSASVNFDRLGGFCAPNDEAAQQKLIKTANLDEKWSFLEVFDSILLSIFIALGIGIAWSQLVQCMPRVMTSLVAVLSILALLGVGIVILVHHSDGVSQIWKLMIAIVSISFAVMFLFFLCFFRRRHRLTGVFIEWSTKLSKEKLSYYLFTLLFIAFSTGLIALCLFQYLAFLSSSQPSPSEEDVFLKLTTNAPLLILVLVELIWGLQFLKDSYNFILSGLATQWYCDKPTGLCETFTRLLKYHFGSVVGGSFLNAFFNLIDFLLEALRCYPDGTCPACAPCCTSFFNCGAHLFDLVRTDVYSYINLTGIAYCNSARYCEHLNETSRLFVGSQSLLYFYRISAYCFTIGATIIAAYFIQFSKLGDINLLSLLLISLFSYCILSFFVDMHANLAEGIQISYLIEESLRRSKDNQTSKFDQFDFKKEIATMEKSYIDGKFC